MRQNVTFSARQGRAMVALLKGLTHDQAAAEAGVTRQTLQRWLSEEAFRTAYRKARAAVVEGAIAELQGLTTDAVSTLKNNLACDVPSQEIAAARTVLAFAMRGVELLDLETRLTELEARIGEEE